MSMLSRLIYIYKFSKRPKKENWVAPKALTSSLIFLERGSKEQLEQRTNCLQLSKMFGKLIPLVIFEITQSINLVLYRGTYGILCIQLHSSCIFVFAENGV